MQIIPITGQTSYQSFGMKPLKIEGPKVQIPIEPSAQEVADAFISQFSAKHGTEGLETLLAVLQKQLPKQENTKYDGRVGRLIG